MNDSRFEHDLRSVLREMAPDKVPETVRAAVAAVPRGRPAPAYRPLGTHRSRLAAVAALAAVTVLAVAGLAVLLSGGFRGQVAVSPSPAPSPTGTGWVTITYRAAPASGAQPTQAQVGIDAQVVLARLGAVGIAASAQPDGDTLSVTVPTSSLDTAQRLAGATGELQFMPTGTNPPLSGQRLEAATYPPLFSSDGVASVDAGTDGSGSPIVDISLNPAAAQAFAAWSSAHVGDYLAIVLDGQVWAAPTIRGAVTDGAISVSAAPSDPDGQQTHAFVDLVRFGPLAVPLTQLSVDPAAPPSLPPASPTAPAVPAESPVAAPPSTIPAGASPATLTLGPAVGLPGGVSQVVHWTGGYVAVAFNADNVPSLWRSSVGRTWQSWADALTALVGTSRVDLVAVAPCGAGVLAAVSRSDGTTGVVWTIDGATLTPVELGLGWLDTSLPGLDGNASVAIAMGSAGSVLTTRDCVTWTRASVSSQPDLKIDGVALLGSRFLVVGQAGPAGSETPLAWWSDDGASWHAARVARSQGHGFLSPPHTGSAGAIAVISSLDAGGFARFYATADGTAWTPAGSPLGVVTAGEGVGSDAGAITSDGSDVLVAGAPGSDSAPPQYWVGDGSGTWTRVTLTGSAADVRTAEGVSLPSLLPNGLLFSTDTGALVATGTLP